VLCDAGANVNARTWRNTTGFNVMAKVANIQYEQVDDSQVPKGATPAFVASELGHVEVIRVLGERGADLNQPTYDGVTPAQIARQNGHTAVLKALRELGADMKFSAR
jgi:ankyrin repeat protein